MSRHIVAHAIGSLPPLNFFKAEREVESSVKLTTTLLCLWANFSVHNKRGQFHKTPGQTSLSTTNGVSFTKLVDKRLCPQQTGSVSQNSWTNVSVHNKRGQFH